MINVTAEEIKSGIGSTCKNNVWFFVFKNAVEDNPTWETFIDHINEEIHTPMDSPLHVDKPFDERAINGVVLKSLFYMDSRLRNLDRFPVAKEIIRLLSEALDEGVYPASVFVNFVGREFNVPRHFDERETIFWQCQGTTFWHVYPPESEFPMSVELSPGDMIYVPKGIRHEVIVDKPRAAIAFGYKNEK